MQATTTAALMPLVRTGQVRIQLQFDNNGERAAGVAAWLNDRYPHIDAHCWAQPGLTCSVNVPDHPAFVSGTWPGSFLDATSPMDIALEIFLECFTDLGLPPGRVLSMHVTSSLGPETD